jgi:RHS repeat-associated protein
LSKAIHADNYSTYDDGDPNYAMIEYRYDTENRLSYIVMEQDASGTPTYYYHLTYDSQDRIKEVFVNNQSLMKYTYDDGTTYHSNQLSEQRYGNDDVMVFHYNLEDQIESIEFGEYVNDVLVSETRFSYEYDQAGNIAVYKEYDENGVEEHVEYYTYDSAGRLEVIVDSDNNRVDYGYDLQGNVSSIDFAFAEEQHAIEYYHNYCLDYDTVHPNECMQSSTLYDRTVYTTISGDDINRNYNYETGALVRLDYINLFVNNTNLIETTYDYEGSTPRLDNVSYSIAGDSTTYKYSYYYDDLGNIVEYRYYENTSIRFKALYDYDELNQLIVESLRDYNVSVDVLSDTNYTKYFEYDKKGNITSQKTYLFGQEQLQEVTIPTVNPDNSYGNIDIYVNVVGDTIIDVGDSLDLLFYYYLNNYSFPPDSVPMLMDTDCDYSSIDFNTAGYYVLECDAQGIFGSDYMIYFEILIKIGDPVGGPTPIQEELDYTYSETWKDQLDSIVYTDNNNTSNNTTYEIISYDEQGNPLEITNFYYDGEHYDSATLSWQGRQLVEIYIGSNGGLNLLNPENLNNTTTTLETDVNIPVTPNTTYTLTLPRLVDYYNPPVLTIEGNSISYADYSDMTLDNGNWTYTFTTNSTETSLWIWAYAANMGQYIDYYQYENFQLEVGSESTDYQPYSEGDPTTLQYTYNDQGYRTEKYVTDCTGLSCIETKTTYFLQGDKVLSELTQELNGTNWVDQFIIVYTYDYDGTIISFHYDDLTDQVDGKEYFYIRNQQRDIMKIVDISGNILVEYRYDAWGNIIDVWLDNSQEHEDESLAVAGVNQYFYRGYRYDSEIHMYYLNSRFYNPLFGRFLNADGLLGAQGNVLGHNMYAYTQNNPVMYSDISGEFPVAILVTSIIIGLVAAGFELGMQHSDWKNAGSEGDFWDQVDWFAVGIEGGSAAIFTALTLVSLGSATAASSSWYMYSRLGLTATTQILRGINQGASAVQIASSTAISMAFTFAFVRVGARPMASSLLDGLSPVERIAPLVVMQIGRQTGMEAARFFSKRETWDEINSILEFDYGN